MKRLEFEEFVRRSRLIHNDVYSYPEQEFVNTKTKITIWCSKNNHFFEQMPSTHLNGKGCKNCSLRKSKEDFLEQASKKYGDRFTYDLSSYEHSTSKINITCNDCSHQFIAKSITHLLAKNGCPKCAKSQAKDKIRKSYESFLEKSIERNGDIFKFEIIDTPFSRKGKLKVSCNQCNNIFESYANNILNKVGCPSCSHNSKHPDTEGFVYQLTYDGIPIPYVGITTTSLKTRLRRHKEAVMYKKSNTILFKYLSGKDMNLLSLQQLDTGKAYQLAEKEDYWIGILGTKFPNGLNKNKGGSGLNLKYDEERSSSATNSHA